MLILTLCSAIIPTPVLIIAMTGPHPAPAASDPPPPLITETEIWQNLPIELLKPKYAPGAIPLVPKNLLNSMKAQAVQGHSAGLATAFGTPTQPIIPKPAAATALWHYLNQGLQFGIQQKLALQPTVQPNPATATSTSVHQKVVKIRDPDLFEGTDRGKLEVYKSQVRNKIRGNASEFPNDASQVSYAVLYLTGAAYAWAAPQVDEQGQWRWTNLDRFLGSLDTAFNDPDQARAAEWEIDRLRQGKDLCSIYYAKFTTLAAKLSD